MGTMGSIGQQGMAALKRSGNCIMKRIVQPPPLEAPAQKRREPSTFPSSMSVSMNAICRALLRSISSIFSGKREAL